MIVADHGLDDRRPELIGRLNVSLSAAIHRGDELRAVAVLLEFLTQGPVHLQSVFLVALVAMLPRLGWVPEVNEPASAGNVRSRKAVVDEWRLGEGEELAEIEAVEDLSVSRKACQVQRAVGMPENVHALDWPVIGDHVVCSAIARTLVGTGPHSGPNNIGRFRPLCALVHGFADYILIWTGLIRGGRGSLRARGLRDRQATGLGDV